MARILLINPPFYRLLGSHYNASSLGIAYVASALNHDGHDAWLYNADYLNTQLYGDTKQIFSGFHDYKEYFKNPDHPLWEEVTEKILEFDPEWIGYTSYTANIAAIEIISRSIKKREPGIKQVIGGTHATLDNQILSRIPSLDFSVKREGETAMVKLVNGQDPSTISGVVSRLHSGSLKDNGDADVQDTGV